jgi:hypothetical protein
MTIRNHKSRSAHSTGQPVGLAPGVLNDRLKNPPHPLLQFEPGLEPPTHTEDAAHADVDPVEANGAGGSCCYRTPKAADEHAGAPPVEAPAKKIDPTVWRDQIPVLPYQFRWIEDDSKLKVAVWSRQSGKSFAAALRAVLKCL